MIVIIDSPGGIGNTPTTFIKYVLETGVFIVRMAGVEMQTIDENAATIVTALRRIQTEGDLMGNFVIFVADQDKNYYIQFTTGHGEPDEMADAGSLYAEAAGNDVLAAEHALKPEQITRLLQLGWHPPSGTPNYSRFWIANSDYERRTIAREVMRTFEQVYGIPSEKPLTVQLEICQ